MVRKSKSFKSNLAKSSDNDKRHEVLSGEFGMNLTSDVQDDYPMGDAIAKPRVF